MRSCRCNTTVQPQRNGLTLIEIVVGLVIMASVLASSLIAFSAHRRQLRHAEQRIEAVAIADELLLLLSGQVDGFPNSGRGTIAGKPQWFWQTSIVGTTSPMDVPLQVIRLRVIETQQDGQQKLLTSVDVVESGI